MNDSEKKKRLMKDCKRTKTMLIKTDQELRATLERIRYFQEQVERLRQVEINPTNYRLSAGGYLAEIDRMNLEVREYLWLHPSEITNEAVPTHTP